MSETKTVFVGQIGRSLPRVEARAKVTGRAEYVHNLRLPGICRWSLSIPPALTSRSCRPSNASRAITSRAAGSILTVCPNSKASGLCSKRSVGCRKAARLQSN